MLFIATSQRRADIAALLRDNGAVLSREDEELAQALAAGQAAKMADPAKAREASGKLIKTTKGGDLKHVLIILALGAKIERRKE